MVVWRIKSNSQSFLRSRQFSYILDKNISYNSNVKIEIDAECNFASFINGLHSHLQARLSMHNGVQEEYAKMQM